MTEKATLAALFDRDNSDREATLDIARTCAKLTIPQVLPERDWNKTRATTQNFQSLGARGVTSLVGKMLSALWPPTLPWFKLQLKPALEYGGQIGDEELQAVYARLFIRELLYQSVLESAGVTPAGAQTPVSFRTAKRRSLTQLIVTGDVLEHIDSNYRIRVFRRDHYVTRRDSTGDWLYSITNEQIDPIARLSREQIEKAKLRYADLTEKTPSERMQRLVTRVEYQPIKRVWVIEQEVNKEIVNASEEAINPYFSTPYDLTGGEDYGRGFVELNRGDLTSYDSLTERTLDYAAAASKITPVIDEASQVRETDLEKKSGVSIRGRVVGGQVSDIGFLRVDKLSDMSGVLQVRQEIRADLGRSMLLQAEAVRDSERTTAFEVQSVTIKELEGALGGVYAPIADLQQMPLIQRLIHQVSSDKMVPPLPKDAIDIQVLTGLAALAKSAKTQSLLNIAQVAQALGPETLAKINGPVLVDVLARYENIHEPGVLKTNEQVQAERRQALMEQAALMAAEAGTKAAGQIAVNASTPKAG